MVWVVGIVAYLIFLMIGILFIRGAAAMENRLYSSGEVDSGSGSLQPTRALQSVGTNYPPGIQSKSRNLNRDQLPPRARALP